MLTSLAPSPMARVTALLYLFTSSTTWAFCIGVTRQQMTVLHKQATSSKTCSSCGSRASPSLFSSGMTVWHRASSLKNSCAAGSSSLMASTRRPSMPSPPGTSESFPK
ncbi:hypothetical protein EYF80_002872 [Liparis tanakae]|uniref:Uncharacterized protein n=1 Tax=Liparis tanakae TaxID=230148 RepID=A0A4Z2JAU5_9TELE|nr:hypothetical protein EYF80_002872 [Liparis tanakae]